ncbi:MAG: molybdopterin-guanine dinucleotide biosynthesis protein B [Chloroflexota bacterium]
MPPVVSFVGVGKSGKTTFLEKLIPELKGRGYRVATIKHTIHRTGFDAPEKDTSRHIRAGSEATAISSPNEFVLIRPGGKDMTLEDMVRLVGDDFDIILTEGFKRGKAPKIEVHRREKGEALGKSLTGLVAVITDETLKVKVRQFSLDDVKGAADLLENEFIKPNRERISLYINGEPVPLSAFPEGIIRNILLGMASSLKGVNEVKSLDISLRL